MSYLENITVNLSITPPVLDMCYHGILLRYWDLPWTDNEEHILKINKLTINGNNNMCHNPNSLHGAAISILLKQTKYSQKVIIINSYFYDIGQRVLSIEDACYPKYNSTVLIANNAFYFSEHADQDLYRQMIVVSSSPFNMTLTFQNCIFYYHKALSYLISVLIASHLLCQIPTHNITCSFLTNV